MPDIFNLTPQMSSYFNALPKSLQENIVQSGAKINSLDDMKAVVASIEGGDYNEQKEEL